MTFTLTADSHAALRADALTAAMADARADADVIAAAEAVNLDGLAGASTANVVVTSSRAGDADGGAAERARTAFEPGDVTVTATITVAYTDE